MLTHTHTHTLKITKTKKRKKKGKIKGILQVYYGENKTKIEDDMIN
jgi:hypothetical protein